MAIEIRLKQKPSNTQYAPLAVLSAYYLTPLKKVDF